MRVQIGVIALIVGLAGASSVSQLPASASLGLSTAADSTLQGRKLAGNGGGKGGTFNNLGLAISSKSSVLSSSTVDRIRAIDAHARHFDHDDGQFASVTPTALELLQQQPNRKLAGSGGGKGGTLNNLGLAVSTRSTLFGKTTADRIHAVEAKARGEDAAADLTPSLLTADLAAVGGRRRLNFKQQLQRILMQAGGFGGGGGLGGGGGSGSSLMNPREMTEPLEHRKDSAALTSMINQAVDGNMDVMSAVMARQQGSARAWEMSLGKDLQQQLNDNIAAGRKLRL